MNYCIQNENNKSRHDIYSMIYIYRNIKQMEFKLCRPNYMTKTEFQK